MRNIFKSALAMLLTLAVAATFTACGPDNGTDGAQSDASSSDNSQPVAQEQNPMPTGESQSTELQPAPEVTTTPESQEPAQTTPQPSVTEDTTPEVTTVSTTASTEKTTEKTTASTTAKTEKTTEKTTEKPADTTKETESDEGNRLPDDSEDEDIDLELSDMDLDEWLDMIGASVEEGPSVDVEE